jgi:endoglucanase
MKKFGLIVLSLVFFSMFSSLSAAVLEDWSGIKPGQNIGTFADQSGTALTTSIGAKAGEKLLKISGNIVQWGGVWALTKTETDLSQSAAIEFQAKSDTPALLQVGITDSQSIQYNSPVWINTSWKKYTIPLSTFSKTLYLDPKAPKDTPINLSRIAVMQFQPLNPGAFKVYIGKITSIDGAPAAQASPAGKNTGGQALQLLKVRGNKIVDPGGNPVILKGVCIADPAMVKQYGYWSEDYFRQAAAWGAKLIRVPIHPNTYRALGKETVFSLLNDAVGWSEKYGMYAIIDWHSEGNPVSGIFPDPENPYMTTMAETKDFWAATAEKFKDRPAAAFYEIFNEPAAIDWKGGKLSWHEWQVWADEVIDTIYKINPNAIPVVGGLDFAFNFQDIGSTAFRNKGIALAAHPYPGHAGQPWEENWEKNFGFMAKSYPVIMTEFGFDPGDKIMPSVYKADADYGRRILAFAKEKGMSWTAFVWADLAGWPMPLYKGMDYTPTICGKFFKEELKRRD